MFLRLFVLTDYIPLPPPTEASHEVCAGSTINPGIRRYLDSKDDIDLTAMISKEGSALTS